MNKRRLRLIRSSAIGLVGFITIVLHTVLLANLPEYLQQCGMLLTTAKIIRVIGYVILAFGFLSYSFSDDNEEIAELTYGPIAFILVYEGILFFYFLRVRIIGYHGLNAYCDSLGVSLIVYAVIALALLSLIRNEKKRRLFFENKSWRKHDDNQLIKSLTGFGRFFTIVAIITTMTIEKVNHYMFEPTGEDNGFGYVDLGLPSGSKWSDRNFLSVERDQLGVKIRWGQTSYQLYADLDKYENGDSYSVINGNDDIVTELMGNKWSIPAEHLWDELISECQSIPTYYKGVYGTTFIGSDGFKRIFMPATGNKSFGDADYWTSTVIVKRELDCQHYSCPGSCFNAAVKDENERNCYEDEFEESDWCESYTIDAVILRILHKNKKSRRLMERVLTSTYDKCYVRPVLIW